MAEAVARTSEVGRGVLVSLGVADAGRSVGVAVLGRRVFVSVGSGVGEAGIRVRVAVAVGESVGGTDVGLTRGVGVVIAEAGDAAPSINANNRPITAVTRRARIHYILNVIQSPGL
jgi:hypothetical protein